MKNEKAEIEREIQDLTKKIIPTEDAKKTRENSEENVEDYYCKDFLVDVKNAKDVVLIMGLNPGNRVKKSSKEKDKLKEKRYGFCCIDNEKGKYDKLEKLLSRNKNIWPNYHPRNYNLFKEIGGKMFWTCVKLEDLKSELENIFEQDGTSSEEDKKKCREELEDLYNEEKNKTGPIIVFTDLLNYEDSAERNIKKIISSNFKDKEEELNDYVKKIIDNFIKFYHPKMIVITNAYTSDLVHGAFIGNVNDKKVEIQNSYDYNGTPIMFSAMVTGGATDKYAYIRLKDDIKEKYK